MSPKRACFARSCKTQEKCAGMKAQLSSSMASTQSHGSGDKTRFSTLTTTIAAVAAAAASMMQLGTPTAYAGLTLSGVLATTAHGSGDKTTSGIWDTLLEITWVDGTGKVHVSKPSDPEFRGMVGGMGIYGGY